MSRLIAVLLGLLFSICAWAQAPVASHAPTSKAPVAQPAENIPPSTVVARVNGVALTQAQLREHEEAIFPYFKMHGGEIPASARGEIREMAMHKLVLDELLYQECKRRGLQVPEAKYRKGLSDLKKGFDSPKEYRESVTKKYGSVAIFESRIRRTLLVRQLWDAEVTNKSIITNTYLLSYYTTNKKRYVRPEAASIQSISFLFKENATPEQKQQARKKAEDCLPGARAAKNYEEFGVIAEKVSEDPWHVMMGDHKWVHRGQVDPQFEQIFSMKAGETSGVLESKEGFHILRVNNREAQRQMTFKEMQPTLRKELQARRKQERAEQFEKALRKNAKIVEM